MTQVIRVKRKVQAILAIRVKKRALENLASIQKKALQVQETAVVTGIVLELDLVRALSFS